MDSCVDEAGHPAALSYLREIGVDAERSVRMIVVTHWHDDHIRGIFEVVRCCPSASFVCPGAFRYEEFLTLVAAYAAGAMMLQTGTQEIGKTLGLVRERGTEALLASENRLLLRRRRCQLWALSPSDESIRAALTYLARQMPRPMESKRPCRPRRRTTCRLRCWSSSTVPLSFSALTCYDSFSDRKRGWLRIVDLQTEYDHPIADVLKVPHHGSSGADAKETWDRLLRARPIVALTPFQQGGVSLPKATDIDRICGKTTEAYITSLPRRGRPPKRGSAVDKTIAGVLRNRRIQSPPFGRVTLRYSSHDRGWTAQLAGAACRLHPGIL